MSCTKIHHPTRDEALEHVKRLIFKNHVEHNDAASAGLEPYPCEHCGTWHVGHAATAPLVWHYTVKRYLDAILESDELRPGAPRIATREELRHLPQEYRVRLKKCDEPEPLLWFSRNEDWEHSVIKTRHPWGRARNEQRGGGLIRFGVPAAYAKLRWTDYLALNPTPDSLKRIMTSRGNPAEWLATNEPVSLDKVRAIEVFYEGDWISVDEIDDEDFDAYLEDLPIIYEAAANTLREKLNESRAKRDDLRLNDYEHIIYEDMRLHSSDRRCTTPRKKWPVSVRV
jgi:hypothetical protein